MTSCEPRSDRNGKVEPAPPEMDHDPALDAYQSWLLAIDALHELVVADLISDHEDRMPQGWLWDFHPQVP
jgi:hypothetical protein